MKKFNLLDSIIVLLASCSLLLFILFLAGRIIGYPLVETLPSWLPEGSKAIWSFITGSLLSLIIWIIRRQVLGSTFPNYLAGILGVTVILGVLLFLTIIFTPDQDKVLKVQIVDSETQFPISSGRIIVQFNGFNKREESVSQGYATFSNITLDESKQKLNIWIVEAREYQDFFVIDTVFANLIKIKLTKSKPVSFVVKVTDLLNNSPVKQGIVQVQLGTKILKEPIKNGIADFSQRSIYLEEITSSSEILVISDGYEAKTVSNITYSKPFEIYLERLKEVRTHTGSLKPEVILEPDPSRLPVGKEQLATSDHVVEMEVIHTSFFDRVIVVVEIPPNMTWGKKVCFYTNLTGSISSIGCSAKVHDEIKKTELVFVSAQLGNVVNFELHKDGFLGVADDIIGTKLLSRDQIMGTKIIFRWIRD